MKKFNIKDKYNFDFFRSPQILYGPPTFYQKKDKKVKGKKIFYAKDGSSYYFVYKHKDNYQFITAYSDINNPNISMNNPDMHFLDKVNENEYYYQVFTDELFEEIHNLDCVGSKDDIKWEINIIDQNKKCYGISFPDNYNKILEILKNYFSKDVY